MQCRKVSHVYSEIHTTNVRTFYRLNVARSQNCEKQLLASPCLSVRMEQFGFNWADFHEIWCLNIF